MRVCVDAGDQRVRARLHAVHRGFERVPTRRRRPAVKAGLQRLSRLLRALHRPPRRVLLPARPRQRRPPRNVGSVKLADDSRRGRSGACPWNRPRLRGRVLPWHLAAPAQTHINHVGEKSQFPWSCEHKRHQTYPSSLRSSPSWFVPYFKHYAFHLIEHRCPCGAGTLFPTPWAGGVMPSFTL